MNPLSIVHIASGDRWAGAEVQLFTLLCALQQQGEHRLLAILMNDGELAEKLRSKGITTEIIDESQHNSLAILWQLRRHLIAFQPDVIHTHRSKENILGALANQLSVRAKSVRTVHGAAEYRTRGLKAIIPWLDRLIGNTLQDHIIAVSADLAEKLKADFKPDKIVVIENGIDVEETERLAAAGKHLVNFDATRTNIGFIGRLEPVKRGDIFLDMARLLVEQHPEKNWHFHVFGEGSQEAAMKAQCERLGLVDAVTFHGHTNQIHPYIKALDAVVMCSDHEGLPMTALECVALGTPLVAHGVGGLVELLSDGEPVNAHRADSYAMQTLALFSEIKPKITSLKDRFTSTHNSRKILQAYSS